MRYMVAASMLVVAGCGAASPPQAAHSSAVEAEPSPAEAAQLEACVKPEIERRVAEIGGDARTAEGNDSAAKAKWLIFFYGYDESLPELRAAAVAKCLQLSKLWVTGIVAPWADRIAARAYHDIKERYWVENGRSIDLQTQEESRKRAVMKEELRNKHRILLAKWGDCIRRNVVELATESDEPAEIIVRATFGACGAERREIEELHTRYGQTSDSGALDVAEREMTARLLLIVIDTRAARSSPQPVVPRLMRPPTAPIQQSI